MLMQILVFIVVSILAYGNISFTNQSSKCIIEWKRQKESNSIPSTLHYDMFKPSRSGESFVKSACHAESALHSCYYHGDASLAQTLAQREFTIVDPYCKPFNLHHLSKVLANRRLVFLGDSHLTQLWSSFFCTFHQLSPITDYHLHYTQSSSYCSPDGQETRYCPLGPKNPQHSLLEGGWFTLPSTATNFEHNWLTSRQQPIDYTRPHKLLKIQTNYSNIVDYFIEEKLTANDIVIVSFGLYYSKPSTYMHTLHRWMTPLKDLAISKAAITQSFPSLFFLETTPQHFPAQPTSALHNIGGHQIPYQRFNGYFPIDSKLEMPIAVAAAAINRSAESLAAAKKTETEKSVNKNKGRLPSAFSSTTSASSFCQPINVKYSQYKAKYDWRNVLLYRTLAPLIEEKIITMIPTTQGLFSQYDSHPGHMKDCSHYCFPSGSLQYLQLMVYNAIVERLSSSVTSSSSSSS